MIRYSIALTDEQTKRAYRLGAPIELYCTSEWTFHLPKLVCNDGIERHFTTPTAEMMIGWLNTFDLNVSVFGSELRGGFYSCFHYGICVKEILADKKKFVSRKEATLAAIDAALEYLEKKGGKE